MLTRKLTKEHRERISRSMMGHAVSQKVRDTIRNLHLGVPLPEAVRRKIKATCTRRKINSGARNGNWKGDLAVPASGRIRAHRVLRKLGPCELCGARKTERHHKDENPLNNKRSNLQTLCRRCHMTVDGRLEKLKLARENWIKGRRRNMSTRGSALQRTVNYFRECSVDEAHVTFQLVKQIVDQRLKGYKAAKVSQGNAASTPRKKRRTKAEIAAAKAAAGGGTQGTL